MLIYPKPPVSRTHGLRLSEDAGNEAGWDGDAREEISTQRPPAPARCGGQTD